MDELIEKGLVASRESKVIEFKGSFDTSSAQDWCEVIKDIIAIANSGGGLILFGLDSNGKPTGFDPERFLRVDPADITNKIAKYTGHQFSDFEASEQKKGAHRIGALTVYGVPVPLVFAKPGTYEVPGTGKQGTAFSAGTVYFRHGAKSEPGNSEDFRKVIEREIRIARKELIRGVRKVTTAPRGSEIVVGPSEASESSSRRATPIRIVDDPKAPAYRKIDFDATHPYRLKEFVRALNAKLSGRVIMSTYDILCLRRLYGLDGKGVYVHKPLYSSPQYSESLISWFLEQFGLDPQFIEKARKECHEKRYEMKLVGAHKKPKRSV